MTEQLEDDFWAEERARDTAARGRQADPGACGTCRDAVAAGSQVVHDECAQRATLLPAPDAPGWELITGLSEEELAALPARFHTPAFVESSTPKAWVCAVCWGDGWNIQWPCKTALEQGLRVFTDEHVAETRAKKQAADLAYLRKDRDAFRDQRNAVFKTNERLIAEVEASDRARLHAENETRKLTRANLEAARQAQKEIKQLRADLDTARNHVAELEAYALGCDAEGCTIPHSSWCEVAKEEAAENGGCTCPQPWKDSPQPHAGYCWLVSPPRSEVEEMRRKIAEVIAGRNGAAVELGEAATRAIAKAEAERDELQANFDTAIKGFNASAMEITELRERVAELEAGRKRYVGKEPTIAEEMAYLSRCIDTVLALCGEQEKAARLFELPLPEWIPAVRQAADGEWTAATLRPALPWAHTMDDHDLGMFLDDLVSAAMGRWRSDPDLSHRQVLADIEKACGDWRTPGQGLRGDEPGAGEGR